MEKQYIKITSALLLVCFSDNDFAENANQLKPAVLVLGTYQMGNPGRDLSNIKADDVRS